MELSGKYYKFKCEQLIDTESHPDHIGILINYDALSDIDMEEIIESMDFTINKDAVRTNVESNNDSELGEPCWKLVDSQRGNLANIENDEFFVGDFDAIMDRLDSYYHDYGYYFLYELENLGVEYTIIEEMDSI